ncbi:MAG: hypothetical protein H0X52_10530 [Gemmatimonadetes bacterium]|nr:hypothetical protein [Gemmatimonadota bacterium]
MRGITLERLLEESYIRLDVPRPFAPYADPQRFNTPSGKIQIHAPELEKLGLDSLPGYTPPAESSEVAPEHARRFPLMLLSPPEHQFLNSTFVNIPSLNRSAGEPKLLLHPNEAAVRGIQGGDRVRVWNDRGDYVACGVVTEDVRPGVAVTYGLHWAREYPGTNTVNQTTSQAETDMGGGAVFYDNAVEVELA